MALWNWRELWIGLVQDYNKVHDVLKAENIGFRCKISSGFYYVYVHEKDLEKAQWLLKKCCR